MAVVGFFDAECESRGPEVAVLFADAQADEIREVLHLEAADGIGLDGVDDALLHIGDAKWDGLGEGGADAETAHKYRTYTMVRVYGQGEMVSEITSPSHPGELDGHLDAGVDAVVDRAVVGGILEGGGGVGIVGDGHGDAHREFDDAARQVGGHDFFDLQGSAGNVDAEFVRTHAHDRGHAGNQSGGDEVGG